MLLCVRTDMLVYVSKREKKRVVPLFRLSVAPTGCSVVVQRFLCGLQGGCFVVVNWAGPGRAGVILGKACFPPLFPLSLSLPLLVLCIDISDLPRVEKVWCLLLVKSERKTALAFPLIY